MDEINNDDNYSELIQIVTDTQNSVENLQDMITNINLSDYLVADVTDLISPEIILYGAMFGAACVLIPYLFMFAIRQLFKLA